jgi:tetratricopeptide (TPR) repeat protein
MKKETIAMALGGLVVGFMLGLVVPRLFNAPTGQHRSAPPPAPPSVPAGPTLDQFNHAIEEYKSLLKDDPQNLEGWFQLGNLYYGTGQDKEAIDSYNKVLELEPKHIKTLTQLGNLSYDSSRYQQATDYYQQVLEQNPELTDVRVDMATMYHRLKKTDEALKQLREAIERDPQHAMARVNLGIVLKNGKQDYQGAISVWQEFLEKFPDHPQVATVKEYIQQAKELL